MPFSSAQPAIASGSRVISATQKLRSLPNTTNWLAYGQIALNFDSIAGGAMYLPPEVLNSSLIRPVMVRKPSASMLPLSPVCSQPSSVSVLAVSSGRLW